MMAPRVEPSGFTEPDHQAIAHMTAQSVHDLLDRICDQVHPSPESFVHGMPIIQGAIAGLLTFMAPGHEDGIGIKEQIAKTVDELLPQVLASLRAEKGSA